jgi:2-polyprenyl-3-methyl-5-hydroxy-6-metoxy-1,4-benzoquinol methylase
MVKTMNHLQKNSTCLACDSKNIHTALDLGEQPLANSYTDASDQAQDRYPLAVNLCHDCFHLQLSHTVAPEIIYKNYLYATGTNQTIQTYSKWFANFVKEYIGSSGSVLDIGCNDGTQLNYFKDIGFDTYGIDPAENLHDRSKSNHNVVCDFFGLDAVPKLLNNYTAITAQNVFAHNPSPFDFLMSCQQLMQQNTLLFIQTSQADMVLNNEFDTIYHEHINFFNANSMRALAQRAGLHLVDVIKTPIHGNSYIFVLSLQNSRPHHVQNIIDMEAPLLRLDTYQAWRSIVESNIETLKTQLDLFRSQGRVLVGYGAAAKGNTLLNYSNIHLDFIIDDNPLKQGKFTPGTATSIVGIDVLDKYSDQNNIVFVPLAWNFFTEIKQRIKSKRTNPTDVFVKYFPTVEVST